MDVNGIRPFRSRKHRPCDLCRKRRSRCAIPEQGSACIECLQTGKPCTFLDNPIDRSGSSSSSATVNTASTSADGQPQQQQQQGESRQKGRKRQKTSPEDSSVHGSNTPSATNFPSLGPEPSSSSGGAIALPPSNGSGLISAPSTLQTASYHTSGLQQQPSQQYKPTSAADSDTLKVSLEATAIADGLEPTAITTLLTDDLLPVTAGAQETAPGAIPTHFQISTDRAKPTFFVLPEVPEYRLSAPKPDHRQLLERVSLALQIANLRRDSLSELYMTICHPALPILPRQPDVRLEDSPASILALVVAKALEVVEVSADLRKHVWHLIKQEYVGDTALRQPTLSSLAVAVLELSACPSFDSRNDYMLLAKTIAHAQLLGLHLTSHGWRIPAWESELRERLWWSLRIHDAWTAFLCSRPSHIQAGNANVPVPAVPHYLGRSEANNFASFSYNCRLSVLVTRLQAGLCLIEKAGDASRNAKLRVCEALQSELAIMEDEIVPLVASNGALPGMTNFRLLLYGFHCMVYRISIELRIGLGAAFLPDRKSLSIFEKFVDFVVNLPSREGFWLPYASHVLSSVLSSLIRLALAIVIHNAGASQGTAQSTSGPNPIRLISQLCTSILSTTPQTWPVARAAAQRAHNVAARLRSARGDGEMSEYADLIEALQGTYVEPISTSTALPSYIPAVESSFGDGAAPSEFLQSTYTDPTFSWSNLDIWLSNLDGNIFDNFNLEPPLFNNEA